MSEEITEATEVADPVIEQTVETKPEVQSKTRRTKPAPQIRDHEDALLELRKENESMRKKLDELSEAKAQELAEQRIQEAKEQAKSEAQKVIDQFKKDTETQTRHRVMKAELKAHAMRAGVVDFDDLYEIFKRDALSKVEFNDDGEVTNAGQLIADLKQTKPHFFNAVNTASTAQVPTAATASKTEKVALTMSKDEYEKARLKLFRM